MASKAGFWRIKFLIIIVDAVGASRELTSRWSWGSKRLQGCQWRSLEFNHFTDRKDLAMTRAAGSVSFVTGVQGALLSPLVISPYLLIVE